VHRELKRVHIVLLGSLSSGYVRGRVGVRLELKHLGDYLSAAPLSVGFVS
jgi:hypothetical protein